MPVGAGFVAGERHIVTCAHVVNSALGRDLRTQEKPGPDARVHVQFPILGDATGAPIRTCQVVAWSPPPQTGLSGGDVAGLILAGEGLPAKAAPGRLIESASVRDTSVEVFGYPTDPPRMHSGAWSAHRLRGAVGGGLIQLDADSESALRAQPGYSGSPVVVADKDGDAIVGMLAIAGRDEETRDVYAIPVSRIVEAWEDTLADLTIPACPYRGLQTFTSDDARAGLFVGRESDVSNLRHRVARSPLTFVWGPSGVGKSSLVTAGLIPALQEGGWITASFRPGQLPFDAMAMALHSIEQAGRPPTLYDISRRAEKLRAQGITKLAMQLKLLAGRPILLCIDQFEEALSAEPAEDAATFLEVILADRPAEEPGLHLVCTLRADFIGQLLSHPDCGPRLADRLLLLSPMGADGLERTIVEPAQGRGVLYEPALARQIARDAMGGGGGLPLLQFALTELWALQKRRRISFSDYHTFGGVSEALSRYAEHVYDELAEIYSEARIRSLLLRMVRSRGGAAEATRRIVRKDVLGEDDWTLVEELAKLRLAVIDNDPAHDVPTAELAHEALISAWPRFEAWVNNDADFQRWLTFMEERVSDGDPLSDRRVSEAAKWLSERPNDIPTEVAALIETSKAALLRASQAVLRRSEERYRSLVKAGAQVVWVTTPTGEIAEDSPEWRSITGQSLEEYLGNGWLDALHPDDRERVERDWQECVRRGGLFDDRYRVRTRAGSYRHHDVRAVPIERDGKIIEWVGASTDVTAQREAEELRGRLTEQLSAAAIRTARLQQATSMLAEALTVEQVVEVITEVGRSAIGADRSEVALLDYERLRVRTVNPRGRPGGPEDTAEGVPLDIPTVVTMAISTRRPVIVESPDALRHMFPEVDLVPFLANTGEQAWVGMPLLAAGAAFGALRFSFGRPRKITDEERVFLEALAGQCALAVERASLFERERTTAETLQRSLLPDRLPSVPGIILDARYLPMTRNMEIGGDWYDAFRLLDGRLAVAAGDVMGKGLSAAARMGRVRNALRGLALTDPEPAAVLSGLDRLFTATELYEQVTTVAYLVLDPVSGEGLAGNAGHPPPLLLSRDAAPHLDTAEPGTLLGWASPRQQYGFRLRPGTTMVLYTDGLVQNRRRSLGAGLDELVAVAAQARPGVLDDPARLLEYLVDRMLTGFEQEDDVTVLVLHQPKGDPAPPARSSGGQIR
jgi:PAS domain S-box-containing protein